MRTTVVFVLARRIQRANNGKGEFSQLPIWMRLSVVSIHLLPTLGTGRVFRCVKHVLWWNGKWLFKVRQNFNFIVSSRALFAELSFVNEYGNTHSSSTCTSLRSNQNRVDRVSWRSTLDQKCLYLARVSSGNLTAWDCGAAAITHKMSLDEKWLLNMVFHTAVQN